MHVRSAQRTPSHTAQPVMTGVGARGIPTVQQPAKLGQLGTGGDTLGFSTLTEERDACGVGFIVDQKARRRHDVIARALRALGCMEHRGGCGGDGVSGDGAGVLTSVPWELFEAEGLLKGHSSDSCGVAMFFLPQGEEDRKAAMATLEKQAERQGLEFLGWREVPQNKNVLGEFALAALPNIQQAFVHHPTAKGDDLEEVLYRTRRSTQADLLEQGGGVPLGEAYFPSFSSRTILYKGMVQSAVLGPFYKDLENELYQTNFAVYHRRFSTNTVPKWPLAQPMRKLAHNGEINTLLGNVNWQRALDQQRGRRDPLCSLDRSDSANLDAVFENLIRGGKSPAQSISILVPEAYKDQPSYDDHQDIVDMFEYYGGLQEAWDGPALLNFCDGKQLGATLDRNGLRPARLLQTKDGLIALMSETGVVDVPDSEIVYKGRLGPGQILTVDLETGDFKLNLEVKKELAKAAPYGEWLKAHRSVIEPDPEFSDEVSTDLAGDEIAQMTAFGWSAEDLQMQVLDMANGGKETLFSMGEDTALAVLSGLPHPPYDYFKQRFAQVTNPPIDPLREGVVMSLEMSLGKRYDIQDAPSEELANQLKVTSPVLNSADVAKIEGAVDTKKLSTLYPLSDGPGGLEKAIKALCAQATEQVKGGARVLILSDMGLDQDTTFIPPLLAVGAVHHHLIKEGLRMETSLVPETAQAWSTHHIACLVGYGASAVHPYLLWKSIKYQYESERSAKLRASGELADISLAQSMRNARKALEAGVLKILSKIGISLLSSYHGAQIFEAIGLGQDVITTSFVGTPSRIGGMTAAELAEEVFTCHETAFPSSGERAKMLQNYGFVKFYQKKDFHENNPPMSRLLHAALKKARESEEVANAEGFDMYKVFQETVRNTPATTIRDMLEIVSDREPIPLEQVQPAEAIMKRFATGGMSLGALSREAHETLAMGVNRAGGRSNSGEGGEDEARWVPIADADEEGHTPSFPYLKGVKNGDLARSKIKQIASGRFGVTPAYLMSAEQIEIKIAQGAKPGEGGQLPGAKVNDYIASIRACKPGVMLISPPPHHDIYSIEDLAQLIYDAHQINPKAKVSVKLVGQVGIGTVASGVAKADADVIQISGHDGGTGASPLTSIKHAGGPWELGLAEAHQALVLNNLRDRVVLRVDGGLKTGYDVVMGALLGADEFGFGTIAMIAVGCIMARICHTNRCPVGVTTQLEKLRLKFTGEPSDMYYFFQYVAEEARLVMASLGYSSLDELVGRADLLRQSDRALAKTTHLDLSYVGQMPDVKPGSAIGRAWQPELEAVHAQMNTLDDELLAREDVMRALDNHEDVVVETPIRNTDRTVGARVHGAVAVRHGNKGWTGSLKMIYTGSAGQSFGAFCLDGMEHVVVGEANDYVGKSMHGGSITVKTVEGAGFTPSESAIVGNTCLYGATGGRFYGNGRAGERFCVRNSNAVAVIEGTGDHCCEYMTGGVVVVLGEVGRNVGAGQTGGWGYFLDEEKDGYSMPARINGDVNVQRVNDIGAAELKALIEDHVKATGSAKGQAILDDWAGYLPKFWQVYPSSEAKAPEVSGVAAEAAAVTA